MSNSDNNPWENDPAASLKPLNKVPPRANFLDIDIRRILSIWPWIILFGFIGFGFAKLYLRYSINVYQASTNINIKEKDEITIGEAVFGSARDPFNDRIAFIKSPALALKVIDSLGLQYQSIAKGRLKDKNLYGDIKWFIQKTGIDNLPVNLQFTIIPDKDGFSYKSNTSKGAGKWGVPFIIDSVPVVVTKLKNLTSSAPVICTLNDRINTAFSVAGSLVVNATRESNIITISYSDVSDDKALDILSTLIEKYNEVLQKEKSQSFSQAIDFIEQRMTPLGKELDSIENVIAGFKSKRGLVGTTANGEIYLQKTEALDKELGEINILKTSITAIENAIRNPKGSGDANFYISGINDQFLLNNLNQYQQLKLERDKLALVATENNPNLQLLQKNIADIKTAMEIQLQSYKNNLLLKENNYQRNFADAKQLLKNTPEEEKILLDKFRLQNIKETLFLALLQKREEAAVAKASVTVNTKILTPPTLSSLPLSPTPAKVLGISVLVAMLLPVLFTLMRELLNRKIVTKRQVQQLLNAPLLAEIEEVKFSKESPVVIGNKERSMIGEQIRALRTNLGFYAAGKKNMYVMITSSMSGEGKSFLSLNLAKSFSLQEKKVALLEFDLRRPKISNTLGIKSKEGLSNFLIGKQEAADTAIQPLEGDPYLHLFPAGPIPPNPQELMTNKRMAELKKYLDENYDIIIIDTPPFGIVADAQIMNQWADVTLMVIRFGFTMKEQILEITEWNDKKIFNNMATVFNGIKDKGYYGYKYGYYYYKRKYGYTYYHTSARKKDASA